MPSWHVAGLQTGRYGGKIDVMSFRKSPTARSILAFLLLGAVTALPVRADQTLKEDFRQAGRQAAKAGKTVGEKVSGVAKKVYHATPRSAETVWQRTERASRRAWDWLMGDKPGTGERKP
jgi:hypothetical protein